MSLKGTPYYGMALDAGASKGDEAEQMAQMIQADDWESQFEEGEGMWLDEIEEFNKRASGIVHEETAMERMARVLRELSRFCHETFDGSTGWYGDDYSYLSDDAKELIKE